MHGGLPMIGLSVLVYAAVAAVVLAATACGRVREHTRRSRHVRNAGGCARPASRHGARRHRRFRRVRRAGQARGSGEPCTAV